VRAAFSRDGSFVAEANVAAGSRSHDDPPKLLNINHHTFRYRKKKLLGE
jgi:hypothetical protein